MNLFAFTESINQSLPAYVSLNRNNYDQPILSVRSRGAEYAGCMELSDAEIKKLRDALTVYLTKKALE